MHTADSASPDHPGGLVATVRKALSVLGPDLRPFRKPLALIFALRLASNVSQLGPLLLGLIIDRALPQRDGGVLLAAGAGLLGAHLLAFGCWALQAGLSNRTSERIFLHLRLRLMHTVLRKPRGFFGRFSPGDVFTRLVHDVDSAAFFFNQNLLRSVFYLIFTVVSAAFMLGWNWKLGLLSLALLVPCYLFANRMNPPLTRRSETAQEELSQQNEVLLDILGGHGEVRFFQQQKHALERFRWRTSRYAEANASANAFGEWMWGGLDLISQLIVLVPFLAGCLLYISGSAGVTVGMLTGFYAYLAMLVGRVQFLFGGLAGFGQAVPSLRRIRDVLDYPEDAGADKVPVEETPENARLEFRQVSFQYPDGPRILDRFDLSVEPGEKVAFMGASGAGKSTVISLLLRFLEPGDGRILFGGRPVESYDPAFYYSYFGYVSQRTNLFDLTVRENVSLGWHSVPEDQVWAALELVRLRETVERLPKGLDTPLGLRGVTLSGGQIQRLALARALVREPEVLVLDEFTSGLDRATEKEILDSLFSLFRNQTILCVTHSPQVAARFPRIVHLPQ